MNSSLYHPGLANRSKIIHPLQGREGWEMIIEIRKPNPSILESLQENLIVLRVPYWIGSSGKKNTFRFPSKSNSLVNETIEKSRSILC